MQRSTCALVMVTGLGVLCLCVGTPLLRAAIVASGDVVPPPPYGQSSSVVVGGAADGTLRIDAGSKIFADGPIRVGGNGNGRLIVAEEGTVSVWAPLGGGDLYIGGESGGTGMAIVEDDGSRLSARNVSIGQHGSLMVSGGGAFSTPSIYIGGEPGAPALVVVDGVGSVAYLNNVDGVPFDYAFLHITNGAWAGSNGDWRMAETAGSIATVTVTGSGSKWTNSGDLYVGRSGTGTLTVADGGLVTAHTLYASLNDLRGNGTISVRGAVLDADLRFDATPGPQHTLAFGSGGVLNFNLEATGNLGAGYKGTGSITIAEGANVACGCGYLGYISGSQGTATVTGTGSKWTNSRDLYVGLSGTGTLEITDGGEVSNSTAYLGSESGAQGTVTVTGSGSNWTNSGDLYVGEKGTGTLQITDRGEVSNSTAYLAYDSGSQGTVIVTGSGSKWTNSGRDYADLYVGRYGTGRVEITAGGQVWNSTAYLGCESGSQGTATVSGSRSKWTNSGELYMGRYGSGTLQITAGGEVSNSSGYLGRYSGSQGTVIVTGSGSKWTNSDDLYVGRLGTGTLEITDGGEVSSSSGCLGRYSVSQGTVIVTGSGSKWTNSGDLSVGPSGTGTLEITDGGPPDHRRWARQPAYRSSRHGSAGQRWHAAPAGRGRAERGRPIPAHPGR